MQGDGRLRVRYGAKLVLELTNSYPNADRNDLPEVKIRFVSHKMTAYEQGAWEEEILSLAGYLSLTSEE